MATKKEYFSEKYGSCAEKDAKWLVTRYPKDDPKHSQEVWVDLKAKNRPPKRG